MEKCPTTGRVHLHVYCQFPRNKRLAALKEIDRRADWELRHGTHEEAKKYCTKKVYEKGPAAGQPACLNGPWFLGEEKVPKQGKRNDWAAVSERCKQGATKRELLCDFPHLAPCEKGIGALIWAHKPRPQLERQVEVWYLYGQTGLGKTHRAFKTFPQAYKIKGAYVPGKSFDMYEQEEVLILDEWSPFDWPMTLMNDILDKWECRLQCRYENKYANWNRVIICTNFSPDECYPADVARRPTFTRRLNHIYHILARDDPPVDWTLEPAVPAPSADGGGPDSLAAYSTPSSPWKPLTQPVSQTDITDPDDPKGKGKDPNAFGQRVPSPSRPTGDGSDPDLDDVFDS